MEEGEGGSGGRDGVCDGSVLLCGCGVYAFLQALLFSGLNGGVGCYWVIGVKGVTGGCLCVNTGGGLEKTVDLM